MLRVLAERLERQAAPTVGVLSHPQSNPADLYRELDEAFGLSLRPSNRWAPTLTEPDPLLLTGMNAALARLLAWLSRPPRWW